MPKRTTAERTELKRLARLRRTDSEKAAENEREKLRKRKVRRKERAAKSERKAQQQAEAAQDKPAVENIQLKTDFTNESEPEEQEILQFNGTCVKHQVFVPVTVKKSTVHGYGAFATKNIRKGQAVCEYYGEHVSFSEANRRERRRGNVPSTYMFSTPVDVIDATYIGNASRYINHGCQPNCYGRQVVKNGVHTVWYYASKKIRKHDELLVDYKLNKSRFVKDAAKCYCNAPQCRGTLYDQW